MIAIQANTQDRPLTDVIRDIETGVAGVALIDEREEAREGGITFSIVALMQKVPLLRRVV